MQKSKSKKRQNDYVEYLRNGLDIRYLSQKYRKAHEWIPRLTSEGPGLTPEEALTKIRKRLTKLRRSRKRLNKLRLSKHIERARREPDLRRSLPVRAIPHRERFYLSSAGSPPSIELSYPRPLDPSDLYQVTEEAVWRRRIPKVLPRFDGIARASGFEEYIWSPPIHDDTRETHFFLSYGAGLVPDDFTGATGLQFFSEIEVQPGAIFDWRDSCGFAGILQYTLPEAPWNGAVQWRVHQDFEIPEITCDADYGYFKLVSTARQSPTGDDFPDDDSFVEAFSLDQLLPIIGASGENFSSGPFSITDTFESGFVVTRGQKPRIYVGFAAVIMAVDGSVSLANAPNMAYHTCPGPGAEPGLSYTFVRI